MPVSSPTILALQDGISQLLDGAFANHRNNLPNGEPPASDYQMLVDAAIEELQRRRPIEEPLPPPATSLISPRPMAGPIADFHKIPILDASGSGTLRRRDPS